MNNAVLGKTMENVRNHRDIYFSENLLAIEMKKTKIKMKKLVYLGISILDISINIILCMNFGMISLNQSMKTEQNYVTWILTALLFIL